MPLLECLPSQPESEGDIADPDNKLGFLKSEPKTKKQLEHEEYLKKYYENVKKYCKPGHDQLLYLSQLANSKIKKKKSRTGASLGQEKVYKQEIKKQITSLKPTSAPKDADLLSVRVSSPLVLSSDLRSRPKNYKKKARQVV